MKNFSPFSVYEISQFGGNGLPEEADNNKSALFGGLLLELLQ